MTNIQRWINHHGQPKQTKVKVHTNDLTSAINALVDLIGSDKYKTWEQGLKMAVRFDREALTKAVQFEYNRVSMLIQNCACENCMFVRKEWAWIETQKVRLELEEMTPGYQVSVQESIDHETERMNKVIKQGCRVKS